MSVSLCVCLCVWVSVYWSMYIFACDPLVPKILKLETTNVVNDLSVISPTNLSKMFKISLNLRGQSSKFTKCVFTLKSFQINI